MKKTVQRCATMILVSWAMVVLSCLCALAKSVDPPTDRPAIKSKSPVKCVLLSVAVAGKRLVSVGERGRIVLSDDFGISWRQAMSVPVSVTLTAVSFVTPEKGWALGHSGIVLHSVDGGESWVKQLDGIEAIALIMQAAKAKADASGGDSEEAERLLSEAQLFVDDGPDKPFLDLSFKNEQTGFIIGAYNLIFRTENGGKTWEPWLDHVDNPQGLHLYGIWPTESGFLIAGEQGLFLRSTDNGQTFSRLPVPYGGSFFGLLGITGKEVIVFGLRGNIFKSSDLGTTWEKVDVDSVSTVTAAAKLRNGGLIIVTQSGDVLESRDKGSTFKPLSIKDTFQFTSLVEAPNGNLVLVGSQGVSVIKSARMSEISDGETP